MLNGEAYALNSSMKKLKMALVSASEAKRLINASGKFSLLLLRGKKEQDGVNVNKLHRLHTHQEHEIGDFVKQFFELFLRAKGLH